ncbi:hypothetical protein COF68_06365 [Bacillus toyonensis]|uniref:hypothetical protein n=1 Tax=Bacillus toyonensis TaxID=155322 RepID=UPI000BFEA9F1|nr:hypothetical protein [Bacillus toyonensis]PHE64458.1 hypothetical protein COF68_06365 [Bacillus toyonensis]
MCKTKMNLFDDFMGVETKVRLIQGIIASEGVDTEVDPALLIVRVRNLRNVLEDYPFTSEKVDSWLFYTGNIIADLKSLSIEVPIISDYIMKVLKELDDLRHDSKEFIENQLV